jgi:hypothetical protein
MPLQIRRGLEAERTQITPTNGLVEGELLYVTDEKKLYIGSGSSGEHQGVIITGYTNNNAKDAAAAIFADGEHTGITFTYDSGTKALSAVVDVSAISGPLVADALQGSVFADDSSLLVDAIDKRFFGNLTGDVTGSIFADDSGIMVDAVDRKLFGELIGSVVSTDENIGLMVDADNGIFNGVLAGGVVSLTDSTLLVDAVNNTITGLIITNSISSADSSSILCDTPFVFETNLTVQSSLLVEDGGDFRSVDGLGFPLIVTAAYDNDSAAPITIRRARGTFDTPSSLNNNDRIGIIQFNGHDGTTYASAASIQIRVAGSVSTGIVPTEMRFLVTNTLGTETEAMRIQSQGTAYHFSNSSTISPLVLQTAHNAGVGSNLLNLQRSRGTTISPTASNASDTLFGIAFQGHDGTSFITAATVRGAVDGTITTGAIPGKLEFITANSSGIFAVNMVLNKDGVLEVNTLKGRSTPYVSFNQMPVLPTYADETAANLAVTTPVNGMMYYDSGAGKIKGYQGSAWVILSP